MNVPSRTPDSLPTSAGAANAPDADHLGGQLLGTAPFPGRTTGLRVYFDQSVHDEVLRHAGEDTSVEICGVLVGGWKQDEGGPYVHISAAIRGDAAASKFAEVTFTHETWSKINERMDKDYAEMAIVGWYHTHPDFGIFLSERDVFIHQHFFSAPGQVALVVDPIRREEGVFIWKGGKPVLVPSHWVGSGQRWAPRSHPAAATEAPRPQAADSAAAAPPPTRAGSSLSLIAMVGIFLVAYMAFRLSERQDHALVAQALAAQLYNQTSAPTSRQSLTEIRALLSEIGEETGKLTAPKKDGLESAKPERVAAAIDDRIARARVEIDKTIAAASLHPDQLAALDWLLQQRLQSLLEQKAPASGAAPTSPVPAKGGK